MTASAIVSVASFSFVLAESFAALGLSTLIPAAFVETASVLKSLAADADDESLGFLDTLLPKVPLPAGATADTENNPSGALKSVLKRVAKANAGPLDLNLLLPKTASIDADFQFYMSESANVNAGVSTGGMIKLVTVDAGFSGMYTASSSNKVHLHVDFETVKVTLP